MASEAAMRGRILFNGRPEMNKRGSYVRTFSISPCLPSLPSYVSQAGILSWRFLKNLNFPLADLNWWEQLPIPQKQQFQIRNPNTNPLGSSNHCGFGIAKELDKHLGRSPMAAIPAKRSAPPKHDHSSCHLFTSWT